MLIRREAMVQIKGQVYLSEGERIGGDRQNQSQLAHGIKFPVCGRNFRAPRPASGHAEHMEVRRVAKPRLFLRNIRPVVSRLCCARTRQERHLDTYNGWLVRHEWRVYCVYVFGTELFVVVMPCLISSVCTQLAKP